MANRNEPIGTCECPVKGCTEKCPVFKYRNRSENPNRRRHAGRLYLVCESHGKSEAQEWILEHADIKAGERPQPKPDPKPDPKPGTRTPARESEKPARDESGGWGFF